MCRRKRLGFEQSGVLNPVVFHTSLQKLYFGDLFCKKGLRKTL